MSRSLALRDLLIPFPSRWAQAITESRLELFPVNRCPVFWRQRMSGDTPCMSRVSLIRAINGSIGL